MVKSNSIIFAGGTDWSTKFLKALIQKGFNVIGVMAPPDSKKGREHTKHIHPLKTAAVKENLLIWQPESLNDHKLLAELKKENPTIILSVAYGKIFPKELLGIPEKGCINIHPSLLPKLRGPSPIQTAILKGLKKTGVSIMKMNNKMDEGPIIAQGEISIDGKETTPSLTEKVMQKGIGLLIDNLNPYLEDNLTPQDQTDKDVSYCKIIRREDGRIDWENETAVEIERKGRAFKPWPGIFTFLSKKKKRVNILETEGIQKDQLKPGHYQKDGERLVVGSKEDNLVVKQLQAEGKTPLTAEEFLRGYEGRFE